MWPAGIFLIKIKNGNTRTMYKNLFKVSNIDTRTTQVLPHEFCKIFRTPFWQNTSGQLQDISPKQLHVPISTIFTKKPKCPSASYCSQRILWDRTCFQQTTSKKKLNLYIINGFKSSFKSIHIENLLPIQRRSLNLIRHLWWSVYMKINYGFVPLIILKKSSIVEVWQGFKQASTNYLSI